MPFRVFRACFKDEAQEATQENDLLEKEVAL